MDHYIAHFGNDADIKGAVVSTFNGGCFFGAAGAGWSNDRFGRKRTIQIACIIALWGCAMQTGANNVVTLLTGRIIAGVAIGVLSMTVPLYNTEVAPPKIRGFLVGLTQQMLGIGFITANWVGYGSQYIKSDASWRLPLGLQMAPAGLLLVGTQFLPYSPLHNNDQVSADKEYTQMYETIKAELSVKSNHLSDLWGTRAMRWRTFVAMGVQIFCQFTGINVINYYGPDMYKSLGIIGGKALFVQGIYGAVGPIANLFFIIFILDRVGRKKPLLFGAGSLVVTFSILAAILATNPVGSADSSISAQRSGSQFKIAPIHLLNLNSKGWYRNDILDKYILLLKLWACQLGSGIRGFPHKHSRNRDQCGNLF
ncbi:unnamed protein product [Cyclocybe aegerita]|uniref:Major facilitator superfamily (MFS) profile domain-containing protein n=1 Tax=Cyclocybe aegerita TaxID=1973307 RepID=A0A8S0WLU1_CYCAE|nr:unnamed protein product [Cyclocybe aegerita]